ncbi:MAG: hypothetical protein KDA66_21845, partial [Planctomycetaceae bacterium]|nr:hypothetical protein [Planctomycetaceae bacterium]
PGAVSFVRPRRLDRLSLAGDGPTTVELPEEYRNANLMIEVRGGGKVARKTYYANSLLVRMSESYGQLQVRDATSGALLPKVYVKVYAKTQNGVRFHKDGYTDIRGRFDYVSLSGVGARDAQRYSVLVLSDDHGAVVREADAPLE